MPQSIKGSLPYLHTLFIQKQADPNLSALATLAPNLNTIALQWCTYHLYYLSGFTSLQTLMLDRCTEGSIKLHHKHQPHVSLPQVTRLITSSYINGNDPLLSALPSLQHIVTPLPPYKAPSTLTWIDFKQSPHYAVLYSIGAMPWPFRPFRSGDYKNKMQQRRPFVIEKSGSVIHIALCGATEDMYTQILSGQRRT